MTFRDVAAGRARLQAQRANARRIIAVIGPPCSGKTTHVERERRPGDIVIDLDALASALGSVASHNHAKQHLNVAHAAREAAIARVLRDSQDSTVWVILTSRHQLGKFGLAGAEIQTMTTDLDECERRAVAAGRQPNVIDLIRSWTG